MKIKIKVQPEDFFVEESAALSLNKQGAFGVYILKKKGWNTIDALLEISRKQNIPFRDFSYGGRKDRYGLTIQYITVKVPKRLELEEKNYSLRFIGFMDRPMGPDLIKANRFELVVRDLSNSESACALRELRVVEKIGYPNYFDEQRFGGVDLKQWFLAEKILKQHYNGALKIYLTAIYPEDKKDEKERKKFFLKHWKNWEVCQKAAKTKFEKSVFAYSPRNIQDVLGWLRRIPKEEMTFFFASYSSYLWNETVRRIIKTIAPAQIRVYNGLVGDYFFYTALKEDDYRYLKGILIPTPSYKAEMPDRLTEVFYESVLRGNKINPAMFNKIKIRQAFFKSVERNAIVLPDNLSGNIFEDEIYKGKKKLLLKFMLPRGSYATMLVKRLFSSIKIQSP